LPIEAPTLHTERLILRPPRAEDAHKLPSVLNDPEISANTSSIPYPYTHDDALAALERFQNTRNDGTALVLFIDLKDSADLIGSVGIHDILPDHSIAELGYALGRPWWGKGYASEASREMMQYVFTSMGIERLVAHAMLRNPASSRVLEKLGMHPVGIVQQCCQRDGSTIDASGFTLTQDQWREATADD
jgi:RimJ/RimL family protein N-acetyltransferase